MTDLPAPDLPAARIGPFAAFGAVAVVGAAGALLEMAYYAGSPVLGAAALGTFVGICGALVVFFVIGLAAPRNE